MLGARLVERRERLGDLRAQRDRRRLEVVDQQLAVVERRGAARGGLAQPARERIELGRRRARAPSAVGLGVDLGGATARPSSGDQHRRRLARGRAAARPAPRRPPTSAKAGIELRGHVGAERRRRARRARRPRRRRGAGPPRRRRCRRRARRRPGSASRSRPAAAARPSRARAAPSSATAARFGPSTPGADDLVALAGRRPTSIRSASASGQNSERSSCRPSSRRGPDVEAEVELRRRAQDHAAITLERSPRAATNSCRRERSRRARPPAGRAPRAPPAPARATPGRACSSERASDLRRCAKASRTSLATGGDGAGPVRRRPQQRRVDPRPRREHGAVDRAQQPHLAGELDEHARRRRRCASRARPAAGRRSRAGPSPSTTRPPAAPRSSAAAAGSRSSRAGWRPSGSAPGRAPRGRAASRRPSAGPTFGVLGRERLQRRAQPLVELDHVHAAPPAAASCAVSAPSPPPTSSTTSSGSSRGLADDRVEQVGVGEEVLAEPHSAHQPKTPGRVRLHRSPRAPRSATPRTSASALRGGDDVGGLVAPAAHAAAAPGRASRSRPAAGRRATAAAASRSASDFG